MSAPGYSLGRRLSWQLAWQTALGLSLLCAVVYAVTALSFADKQRAHLGVKLAASRDVAVAAARAGGEALVAEQVGQSLPRRPYTLIELRRADGALVYRDPRGDSGAVGEHTQQVRFEFAAPGVQGGTLKGDMLLDTAEDARMLRRLAWTLLAVSVCGGLLAGLATAWRVRRALQPLQELVRQTEDIAPGRMQQRLALSEPIAELQPWIDQFNAMLRRLERAYVQLEAFNADVAHELRTPLAALMGHTEVALSRERSTRALRDTLSGNLEELQRLSALVNDMLFLSRADRGACARRGEAVSLQALAAQVVDFHEAPLTEAQVQVRLQGDALMAVDEPLFKRAVSNLLGNATRFSARGSVITVRIAADAQGQAEVVVENNGQDIATTQLPRLFDRFFRIDTARTDGQTHHGLGLAIVAAIARMHAGRTLATSGSGITRIGFSVSPG